MRVIAGAAKGVRLGPVPPGTRPISDRAREGVFSSLAARVPGAMVLDLYAGTGAAGIEALSRGADHATFVDRSRQAIRTIHDNLQRSKLTANATVVEREVARFLGTSVEPFDLVFVDPPYDTAPESVAGDLEKLAGGWLAEGATVALTRPRKGYIPVIPVSWQVARRLEYGDTLVVLYREV
ncbi:MAG: 16S rRNA (guanine(966)-N(2))-methyltransferase RsmD [Actinomycetota bacterium]|nr:16S rRNA (guanine(966)-N(2))-methyltransferase RsmD [Actinomycetota bacterium]